MFKIISSSKSTSSVINTLEYFQKKFGVPSQDKCMDVITQYTLALGFSLENRIQIPTVTVRAVLEQALTEDSPITPNDAGELLTLLLEQDKYKPEDDQHIELIGYNENLVGEVAYFEGRSWNIKSDTPVQKKPSHRKLLLERSDCPNKTIRVYSRTNITASETVSGETATDKIESSSLTVRRFLFTDQTEKTLEGFRKVLLKIETESGEYYGSDTDTEPDIESLRYVQTQFVEKEDPDFDRLLNELNADLVRVGNSYRLVQETDWSKYDCFVIPQYRGIAYSTHRWTKPHRQLHRRQNRLLAPVFCEMAKPADQLKAEFYLVDPVTQCERGVLVDIEHIQSQFVELRRINPVLDRVGQRSRDRWFASEFDRYQSGYSEDYEKAIGRGGLNRMVSTANSLKHALYYALGDKAIGSEKETRLRPRWHKNGKAQHPYSGKVSISFHPISDYLAPEGASHVPTGVALGALRVESQIVLEGESSFLGLIRDNRVVIEQVVRWPSFHKETPVFGMTPEEYDRFRLRIRDTAPHSSRRKAIEERDSKSKTSMLPKMIFWYEAQIGAAMNSWAKNNHKRFIYRTLDGQFSFTYTQPDPYGGKNEKLAEFKVGADPNDLISRRLQSGYAITGSLDEVPNDYKAKSVSDEYRKKLEKESKERTSMNRPDDDD